MLMKEMFGKNGSSSAGSNPFGNMLPFMMMGNNGLTDMFSSMFDEDEEAESLLDGLDEDEDEETSDEAPADEEA